MLAVLDTNVIVAALRSADGASFQLLKYLRSGEFRAAITAPLIFEYEDVLSRPGLLPHLGQTGISAFLDWFVSVSKKCNVHFLWRPLLRDPKDDMVLEAAMACSANFLVTFNLRDFREASSVGVQVITPCQFLTHILAP